MTVYAFGLEEHSYFNAGGHKGDLYYYNLGGRLQGSLDNRADKDQSMILAILLQVI
jgi:hypothetical protein